MNEQAWDEVAEKFEEEIFNVPANDRKGLIAGHVERLSSPDAVATDLGCGVGRTLHLLSEHFRQVYAVDVSSQCLHEAEASCSGVENIRYVHADLTTDRNSYPATDFVLCINTWLNASLEARVNLIDRTCRSVKRGGHLLLVVPSLNSALLTTFRRLQWNLRDGMAPKEAQQDASVEGDDLALGVVTIDGVPTKHYLQEELEALLGERGFTTEHIDKIEYPWTTEFADPPRWMKAPYPWDWLVLARRR